MGNKPETKSSGGLSKAPEKGAQKPTKEQRIIQAAMNGQALKDAKPEQKGEPNPLAQAVAYVCSLHGLDPPEDIDWPGIEQFMREGAYKSYTVQDVREAAFAHVNGWVQEVPTYGRGFNTLWLGKLLEAYSKIRGPIVQKEQQRQLEKPRGISEEQKKENERRFWEIICKDFDQVAQGGKVRVPIPLKYDRLVDCGIMPEPNAEKKREAMARAKEGEQEPSIVKRLFRRQAKGYELTAKMILVEEFFQDLAERGEDIRDYIQQNTEKE